MTSRIVTDSAGRTWTCATTDSTTVVSGDSAMGRDVILACATDSVASPVAVTVGWQWEKMAPAGLARLVSQASPVPRNN